MSWKGLFARAGLTTDGTNLRTKNGQIAAKGALFKDGTVPAELDTAGVIAYTIAQLLTGLILRDPNGAGRADTAPTAVLIVAGIKQPWIGCSFEFTIRNTANGNETITLTTAIGITLSGTMTLAQHNSKRFL